MWFYHTDLNTKTKVQLMYDWRHLWIYETTCMWWKSKSKSMSSFWYIDLFNESLQYWGNEFQLYVKVTLGGKIFVSYILSRPYCCVLWYIVNMHTLLFRHVAYMTMSVTLRGQNFEIYTLSGPQLHKLLLYLHDTW